MKLQTVHKVLIAFGILFCLGFGLRELLREAGSLGLGGFFLVAGVGLGFYLGWFIRKMPRP